MDNLKVHFAGAVYPSSIGTISVQSGLLNSVEATIRRIHHTYPYLQVHISDSCDNSRQLKDLGIEYVLLDVEQRRIFAVGIIK